MTQATIGSLRVSLGLNSAEFTEGLTKAQKHLKDASKGMSRVGSQLASVAKVGAAGFAAVGVAIGGTLSALNGLADKLADVKSAADTAGVGFKAFQELKFVADQNRISVESLTDGLKEMQLRTDEFITTGSGPAAEAFGRLGLGAEQLKAGLTQPAALFEDLIGRMQAFDKAAQIRIADEIFGGTGGEDFVRLIDEGADGIKRLREQFAASGAGVSEGQVKVMTDFQAAIRGVGTVALGLATDLATSGLVQALTGMVNAFSGWVSGLRQVTPQMTAVGKAMAPVGAALGRLWTEASKALGPALVSLFETASGMVKSMAGAWQGFFESDAGKALGRFAAVLTEVLGGVLIRVLTAGLRIVEGVLKNMGIAFSILGDLLTGDFAGAFRGVGSLVVNAVRTMGNVIEAVFPGALGWVRKLYEGVKAWLMDKLGAAMDWVAEKARQVGDAFFKLYDRVVGHSYIPDMVDGIATHIARLQTVMVDPITRATEVSAARFEKMGDDVRRVIEGLLTDRERLDLAFAADTGALDAELASGRMTAAEHAEWSRRNRARYAEDRAALPNPMRDALGGAMGGFAAGFGQVAERMAEVSARASESFSGVADTITTAFDGARQAADDFAHRFADTMESVLRGDIKGVLNDILSSVLRSALLGIGKMIQGWGSGQGGIIGSFFSALPGFATGGSFTVGGSGGVDSQVMAFRATPGEMVDIRKPGQSWGGGGNTYVLSGNLLTPEFWQQIKGEVAAGEARAVRKSAEIGKRAIPGLQQRQTLLGST